MFKDKELLNKVDRIEKELNKIKELNKYLVNINLFDRKELEYKINSILNKSKYSLHLYNIEIGLRRELFDKIQIEVCGDDFFKEETKEVICFSLKDRCITSNKIDNFEVDAFCNYYKGKIDILHNITSKDLNFIPIKPLDIDKQIKVTLDIKNLKDKIEKEW